MINKYNLSLIDFTKLSIAILCIPLLSVTAHANEGTRFWSRIGPEGADISQLVISSSHPNTLYAATIPSSYYSSSQDYLLKSLNGGDSWVTLPWQGKAFSTDIIVANRTHQQYSSYIYESPWKNHTLGIDLLDPDTVFTSLSGFLLKTNDGGISWHPVGADINLDSAAFFIANPLISSSLNTLVAPDNEIARSDDGGEHWVLNNNKIKTTAQQTIKPSRSYPDGESTVQLLTIDPKNSAILYGYSTLRSIGAIANAPVLLYKSVDLGQNWQNITPIGYQYLGGKLVFNPDNSNELFSIFAKTEADSFVSTVDENIVMRSDNGGTSWQALSVPAKDSTTYDVTQVYLDASDKNTLYANIKPADEDSVENIKAIAKSINSGESWEIIDISPYFSGNLVIDPSNNQKLLMASKQGVLCSDNGGQNWKLSNKGIQHIGGKLSVATDNDLVMYLAGNDRGGAVVDSLETTGFYYKSIDGGQHWDTITPSTILKGYCREFKINPKDDQDIFCLTDENIFQSLNSGEHWTLLKNSKSRQLVRAQDGQSIYLSDNAGTSVSKDNGKSWRLLSTINEGELSVNPKSQAILYYVVDNQLYSSIDSGEHWLMQETPDNIAFNHLIIHPLNPDLMVLYGYYGYLLTNDGGNNWQTLLETVNNGNPEINSFPAEFNFIFQLVFNPTKINSLFIKTSTGIYESSDQGAHWEKRNWGIESYISDSYMGVNLFASSKNVYIDTPSGVFKLTDKVSFSAISDCIFSWVEQKNTALYNSPATLSGQWHGYTFRYYSQSNTYLGILHEQEVHQLQPNLSGDIMTQGSIASYQSQSGCLDTRFKLMGTAINN